MAHRESLAATLGEPDQCTGAIVAEAALNHGRHGGGLVLAEDVLVELFIFLGEDDEVLQEGEQLGDGAEAVDLGLKVAHLLVLPGKEVAAHGVPRNAIAKADSIGGAEQLLGDEQLGRFAVVAADLINAEGNGLVLSAFLHSITRTGRPLIRNTTSSRVPWWPL